MHGYLVRYRVLDSDADAWAAAGRAPQWGKVEALREALAERRCSLLALVDTDAYVHTDEPLEALRSSSANSNS